MVWDRNSSRETPKKNEDFGIIVMKGSQEAIDKVKYARRHSESYLNDIATWRSVLPCPPPGIEPVKVE